MAGSLDRRRSPSIAASSALRLTLTESAVLGLLGRLDRSISGNDLQKVIVRSVGCIWKPSKTQLYVALRRLVAAELTTRRDVATDVLGPQIGLEISGDFPQTLAALVQLAEARLP